jgi:hypothetical protein
MGNASVTGNASLTGNATEGTAADLRVAAVECVPVLGEDMTAYLAGADSVAQFEGWLAGISEPAARTAPSRLSTVLQVLHIFAADNLSSYVKEWLRNVGAGGSAPARTIREAVGDDHAVKDVLHAATTWISDHRRPRAVLV